MDRRPGADEGVPVEWRGRDAIWALRIVVKTVRLSPRASRQDAGAVVEQV
jgi:hypothetical protein